MASKAAGPASNIDLLVASTETLVLVPSITSNLPPSIISDLITSMIESLEPWADMWPWFKSLTLVCRSWSAEARRLEFLRISVSAHHPEITQKLIAHVHAIRERGDVRALTRSLAVEGTARYGQFSQLKDLLAALSIRSLRELEIRSVRDWHHCLSHLGEPEHCIFTELREMVLHRLTPIVIHRALLSCNPEFLERLSINPFKMIGYNIDGEDDSHMAAIQQLTFPALRWLYFRLMLSRLKTTAQQILQDNVTPNIQILSVFVRSEHVPFLVDVLCRRTTTAIKLQFQVFTLNDHLDSMDPDISRLMAHAERYLWNVDLMFTLG